MYWQYHFTRWLISFLLFFWHDHFERYFPVSSRKPFKFATIRRKRDSVRLIMPSCVMLIFYISTWESAGADTGRNFEGGEDNYHLNLKLLWEFKGKYFIYTFFAYPETVFSNILIKTPSYSSFIKKSFSQLSFNYFNIFSGGNSPEPPSRWVRVDSVSINVLSSVCAKISCVFSFLCSSWEDDH